MPLLRRTNLSCRKQVVMKTKLVGTEVRLVYPLQAVVAEGERSSALHVPKSETLSITEVANEVTGLLTADWNGKRILFFEQDLEVALDGKARYQLPPDSSDD